MSSLHFRECIPNKGNHPQWGAVDFKNYDIHAWAEFGLQHPALRDMWATWQQLYAEPFRGVTADGVVKADLFELRDEDAPTISMKDAATALIGAAESAGVAEKLRRPVESPEWRCWSNPEFYLAKTGIRLEEVNGAVNEAALNLVRCCLSRQGYDKILACMRVNHFLGELVDAGHLMNDRSYNMLLFGEPSLTAPWGWSLWGHHLTVCIFVVGTQMVASPVFMGCEPNCIDDGPHAGTEMLEDEMSIAKKLLDSLSTENKASVVLYNALEHPDMPNGFPHPADGRNLAGAYEDNRIIPYSGGRVSTFNTTSQSLLVELVRKMVDFLPDGPLEAKMADVKKHLTETWLLWMGNPDEADCFHFRIQSPAILCEFDHERGMWLTNSQPGRFHIHTVVRTPNGNDYGKKLLDLWQRLDM